MLSVATDEQWAAMVDALGRPDWATDPALATHAGRRAAHDLLDEKLGAWAADIDLDKAIDLLLGAGVPAAPAYDARLTSQHPQFVARGYYEQLDHPVIGVRRLPVPAVPLRQRRPLARAPRPRCSASTTTRSSPSSASPTTRSPSSKPTT